MAFDFEFPAKEDPDWGGARTKRAVLMTPSAEWVQSVFSCQFELNGRKLITPNRDFPYEGLLVYLDGEHWKFIDCIAVAIRSDKGVYLPFVQDTSTPSVRVNPWNVTYNYRCTIPGAGRKAADLPFSVSYRLHSICSPELITGSVEIAFPHGLFLGRQRLIPTIIPFLDIRHMYGSTDLDHYHVQINGNNDHQVASVTGYNRNVTFHFRSGKIEQFASPETLHWYYKLGVGQRTESFDLATSRWVTMFAGEEKAVTAFFCYRPLFNNSDKRLVFFFECRLDTGQRVESLADFEQLRLESIQKDKAQEEQVQKLFRIPGSLSLHDAILSRIVGLTKFKTFVHNERSRSGWTMVPHAGAWWFHTPWYRDVFEGLLSSFKTLMTIPEEREIVKEIICFALSLQDDITGLIPTRIPEFGHQEMSYNSSDASLLCFLVAEAYLRTIWDPTFAMEVVERAMKMVTRFVRRDKITNEEVHPDGPPRLDNRTGLLLTAPHHSWIDTCNQWVQHAGHRLDHLPNRFSSKFVEALCDHLEAKQPAWSTFVSPCFFLPEVNAQWIKLLRGINRILDVLLSKPTSRTKPNKKLLHFRVSVSAICAKAEQNYFDVFWNDKAGYLFNAVYKDGHVKDAIECETGLTAAALLGESIFKRKCLQRILECTKRKLLIKRQLCKEAAIGQQNKFSIGSEEGGDGRHMRAFGILTKNEACRTFYNDGQYHSGVIWLRSTHYLVMLLRILGEKKLARDVILNILDHQMTEGAIFYNNELLSLPFGNNPLPMELTAQNPVPVKNPIQFWSQWCDQMLEVLGGSIENTS